MGGRAGAGALEGAPRFGRKEAARPRTAGEGSVRARPRPPAPCRGQCATGTRGGATRSRAPRGSRPQRRWTLSRAPPAPRSEQPDLPGRFLGVADDPSLMKRATLGSRESRPSSHDRFGSEELGFPSPNPPAAYCAPPPLPPLAVIDPRAPRDSQSPPFFIGGLYLILFAQLSWRRVNKGVESGEKAFPRWKQ